ncbi:MAG: ribose 5-phosphate isomerase B [Anaerolineales bacterium]|nr:ribose 5-phosphate isomerase B [Anaerolineales bacterium]
MTEIKDADLQKIVDQVVSGLVNTPATSPVVESGLPSNQNVIAIGADHGGFDLKAVLIDFLAEKGYRVDDCGTFSKESVDYPDFAETVARKVASGKAWRGIMIDGAGIGSNMAANKVTGVRSAMCYDHATASNAREHNNANLLCLGAGLLGVSLVKQIVTTFLDTGFGGGRHAQRVDKIMEIEKRR